MDRMRRKRGRVVNYESPIWEPLVTLTPDNVGDFMWMHEVELEDGTRLHAYKHYETRRYLHLDHGGRAFVFIWHEGRAEDEDSQYEEVDPQWLLELVLAHPDRRASLFRQNLAAEFKRLRWDRLIFLGEDSAGIALEVIAVETGHENLLVIHAMELRPRYESAYREVRECNK